MSEFTYKLNKDIISKQVVNVIKYYHDELYTFIPFDPDNTQYQEYLKWVAEGNEPLPAEDPVPADSGE